MLCLECGKREAKYEGLCEECFLKKVKFTQIPQYLELVMCPHCHAIKLGAHWEHMPVEEALKKIIEKNISLEHDCDSYSFSLKHGEIDGGFEGDVFVKIKYEDLTVEEFHKVVFNLKYESCPRCNRFFGNYFEAIIQLRSMRENELEEILNFTYEKIEQYSKKNENLFLTKEVKKKGGWDLYISDKKEAKKIARDICHKYGASMKESPKIAGRKDGKDIYRVTYAVRFPSYRVGDIVEIEGNYYVVDEINDSFIYTRDLKQGKKKSIDSKRHRIEMVEKRENLEKALIIYSRGRDVQLLDKYNRVIDIHTETPVKDGETVNIVRIEENVYIVPK